MTDDDAKRYLHCAVCIESGLDDQIGVYVDATALTVVCHNHDEEEVLVRLIPAAFAPFPLSSRAALMRAGRGRDAHPPMSAHAAQEVTR